MKKWLSILLLMIYTAASGGTVISAHYCMGDFAAVSFGERDTQSCSFCGMEDEGCCHDLPQVIKIENSNLENPTVTQLFFQPAADANAFFWPFNKAYGQPNKSIQPVLGYKIIKPPVYLLNCNFRI